jgi:hypothetical protein
MGDDDLVTTEGVNERGTDAEATGTVPSGPGDGGGRTGAGGDDDGPEAPAAEPRPGNAVESGQSDP